MGTEAMAENVTSCVVHTPADDLIDVFLKGEKVMPTKLCHMAKPKGLLPLCEAHLHCFLKKILCFSRRCQFIGTALA
ncbi:MAG: hypothetical protein SWE60_01250 [Thermodesulfobacteriota bacterium]|nr:hypothetical protein [Thermodesulfobacteriota bacterium]